MNIPHRYTTAIPEDFDWIEILQFLSDGGNISSDQRYVLMHMSKDWVTCACGQFCKVLPKTQTGAPKDNELKTLGTAFYDYVRDRQWRAALYTILKIEARSKVLLEEHYKKQTPPVIPTYRFPDWRNPVHQTGATIAKETQ